MEKGIHPIASALAWTQQPHSRDAWSLRGRQGGASSRAAIGQIPRAHRSRLGPVSSRPITDQLVQKVADDLRARYALDDDDVRALGARLANHERDERRAENVAFAERFSAEHHETLDRLGR
jgi:hypothetical protein